MDHLLAMFLETARPDADRAAPTAPNVLHRLRRRRRPRPLGHSTRVQNVTEAEAGQHLQRALRSRPRPALQHHRPPRNQPAVCSSRRQLSHRDVHGPFDVVGGELLW